MFAAYKSEEIDEKKDETTTDTSWLKNKSYKLEKTVSLVRPETVIKQDEVVITSSDSEQSSIIVQDEVIAISSTTSEEEEEEIESKKKKKKKESSKKQKKKSKKKKKRLKEEKKEKKIDESQLKKAFLNLLFDDEYKKVFENVKKEKLNKAVFIEDIPDLTYRHAYRIDKRPDMNNLCFDTLYFKDIAKYRVPDENQSLTNKKARKQKRKKQLAASKSCRYFTLVPKVIDKTSESGEAIEPESDFIDRTSDFNKYLNENPKNVDKWLEFVEYQDDLAEKINKFSIKSESTDTKQPLYMRKLAIFERALKENPNNFQLRLEVVKLKSNNDYEIDTIDKIDHEFHQLLIDEYENQVNEAVKRCDNLFIIWSEYIKFFKYKNMANLNYFKIKKLFIKCFDYFLNENFQSKFCKSEINRFKLCEFLLKLVRSNCNFMRECGYDEKAIGLYQALVDFNFNLNGKSYKNLDFQSRKSLFELCYDSCLPKFGELCSIGWLNCLENKDVVFEQMDKEPFERVDRVLDDLEETIINNTDQKIENKWLDIEHLRYKYNWYPFYVHVLSGESADDCVDNDRLINFEDDLNYALFDFETILSTDSKKYFESFKLRLFCQYLQYFQLVNVCENVFGDEDFDCDDEEYCLFLSGFSSTDSVFRLDKLKFNYIYKLFDDFKLINGFISLIRDSFRQAIQLSASNLQMKTNLIVLKWKFELILYQNLRNFESSGRLLEDLKSTDVKNRLLNEAKSDLGLDENRSNAKLWLEYAIMKYALSKYENTKSDYMKEIRKIFEMLFKLNEIDRKLCCIYTELELNMYERLYDVVVSDNGEVDVGLATIQFHSAFVKSNQIDSNRKQYLIDLIVKNCIQTTKAIQVSSKANQFSIGIKESTKVLLIRKEFTQKYESLITNNANPSESYTFYRLYSLYLLLNNDYKTLFEINKTLFTNGNVANIDFYIEYYLKIVNYMFYSQAIIDKNEYKTRFFDTIAYINKYNRNLTINSSMNRYLQLTILNYKTNICAVFCSQLLENNKFEDLMNTYVSKCGSGKNKLTTLMTLLFADVCRLERIINNVKFDDGFASKTSIIPSLGLHNQIRKRFDYSLKCVNKSLILWLLYFRFEFIYKNNDYSSKAMYLYYQSIRNLPFAKLLYLEAIEYLPEKFNEIMKLFVSRDIRLRIPIEELNMLLEPIESKKVEDMEISDDDDNVEVEEVDDDEKKENIDDIDDQNKKENT